MFKVKVLSQENTEKVLDMKRVIKTIEEVYTLKAKEAAVLFPMVFHEFEKDAADMDIKSGHLKEADIYGLKLVSWFGGNEKKNLPNIIGTVMIFDSKTGQPLALLSAEHMTGMRTGAAGAIGAKYLARKDSENLLIVGTGHQAKYQIAAVLIAMDNLKTVRIYNPHSYEKAVKFQNSIKNILVEEFLSKYEEGSEDYKEVSTKFNVEFEAVADFKKAVEISDIIITATPSRKPLIMKKWVKKGTHFSCVGADMEGKQEIDESIFASAKVYVDDINQAVNVGETEVPIKNQVIKKEDIIAEIGEVILGNTAGRSSSEDITIYDSTGIALQDLLTAKLALDMAEQKDIGVEVEL